MVSVKIFKGVMAFIKLIHHIFGNSSTFPMAKQI